MKTHRQSTLANFVCILLATAMPALAAEVTWAVKIYPANSSCIVWSTDSPPQGGTLVKSGSISFNVGGLISFQFLPGQNYKLTHVYKNSEDEIGWVSANGNRANFGPVPNKSHTILAVCELISPTGTFAGNYTDGKSITPIADVTGNYQGNGTIKNVTRAYNVDVAMDESGKLSTLGTVEGIKNKDGGDEVSGSVGSVKTVDDKPCLDLKGTFKGTRDGKPATGSAAATGDLVFETVNADTQMSGVATYSAVVDGKKSVDKPAERTMVVPPADVSKLKKSWGLALTLVEKTPLKGKKYVEATGTLRLTSGEYSKFPAKKVTYGAKTGYMLSLASGQKLDTLGAAVYVKDPKTGATKLDKKGNPIPVIDKKSSVNISKMVLTQAGGTWSPTGGSMKYKFLGQKGKGELTAFLD